MDLLKSFKNFLVHNDQISFVNFITHIINNKCNLTMFYTLINVTKIQEFLNN